MKRILGLGLLSSLAFTACTNQIKPNFDDRNSQYYYCAYVSYLEMVFEHQIDSKRSLGDFEFTKKLLNEIAPKGDANYYKVVSKNNKKMVYVHSMKTDKLKEVITLNEKDWMDSKKIFDNSSKQIKECKWSYFSKKENMTITQKCDDNSKVIKYFSDTTDEELRFKNNKLVEKLVYDKNTIYRYDRNGKLLSEFSDVSESDMCIPFKPYSIEPKLISF